MKHIFLLTLSSFTVITLFTGCTSQMASMSTSSSDKEKECLDLDKKLIKVDQFLEIVNTKSAFHLEEAATAVPTPQITESNNKQRMLKDGNKRRTDLLEEQQKLGCEPIK